MQDATSQDDTTRIPSATFESIAVERGLLTTAQIVEGRSVLQMLVDVGMQSSIADVFQKKGWLDAQQVAAIEAALGRSAALDIAGYEIVTKVAEGGMGAVYKARQTSMDRFVAIKVLLPKFAEDKAGRERFVREARAVARLSHPNVVAGIDAGESHGICYFVMEFIDGAPLDQVLRERGALPWRDAVAIMLQMARALEHAHKHGIVHRDIKPGNIMLQPDGTAKLADLGLARVVESQDVAITESGMIVGSPAYLSPEQAVGDRAVDIRSDIFSLGLTFFELVAGERAYAGTNPMSIMTALLTRAVPMDKVHAVDAPAAVAAVIAKMTQREPVNRYDTPRALIEDLEAVLVDRSPEHAMAPPPDDRGETSAIIPANSSKRARMIGIVFATLAAALVAWQWPNLAGTRLAVPSSAIPVRSLDPATGLRIDLIAAIELAQAQLPGAPTFHAELERDEYSIDMAYGKRTRNVLIDGRTGAIKDHHEEDEDHSADVEASRITLTRATQAAELKTGARAVEAEIRLLPGRTVIEIKLLRDRKASWIDVDAITGETAEERARPHDA